MWWYEPDVGPSPPPPPAPPSPPSYIKSKETGQCLDIPGGDTGNGNKLWVWECDSSSPNQKWRFENGALILDSNPSKCVDLYGFDTHNGNLIEIWDCSGTP